jgi:hypothetical protein
MIHPLRLLLGAIAIPVCSTLYGQTSLPANTIVTQNFNSIGNSATATLPANWKLSSAGTGSTSGYATGTNITATTQAAGSGTPATGGAYNWATAAGTDRAIGFMTTALYASPNSIMAFYRNTTGATVNSVTVAFSIERYIVNTSTVSVALFSSTDGSAWIAQTAGNISTADFPTGANSGTFTTPKTINKTVAVTVTVPNNGDIYFRWVFINTGSINSQGLGLDNVSVFAGTATPIVIATLRDILQVDNGIPNQFNEGDVIRYQTLIKNTGTGDANNVQITLPAPPANTAMVAGSIKTSAVAVNDSYAASFNTTLNASTVLVNDIGIPVPTAVLTYGPTADAALYNAGAAGTTNAGGTITLNANGTFTYIPLNGFSGIDQFKYITGNGNLPDNDAIVTITVGTDITFTTTNVDPLCNGGTNGSITISASGGNGALTYSITGAGGTYFASNVFTGLAAGTYNLAVKDAGGLIKTGTATLNNPASIVVSGTVPTLTYNTAMATATFTKTGGTGTITWSATGLPAGVTINASTGDVTGTATVTGSFSAVITATDANGCTGTKNATVNVAPKLTNDTYAAVGNTQLVADGHSSPATPFAVSAINILTNDASDAAITVTAGTFATTNGGSITINAAGKFTYTPLNGSLTADSYTYTATSNTVSATATINFTVANMVWYVNNTYAGANGAANGSSHRPYTDVASAETASAINQIIYIHTGSGNTTGNAVLKSGQTLRGAGSALNIGALSIAAGTKPTLTGMITLANSVAVDGFDMTTGTTTAITSTGATGVTVTVGNVTTGGAVNAVTLTNTTGSVIIAGGTQTGSTGATFNISGGTVSLTYSGNITQAANAAMVSVSGNHIAGTVLFQTGTLSATNGTGLQFDNADGTYNFNGTTTLNGGDAGIDILNGSSGTFSFLSGIAITNPSGEAIKISASTANVTYSGTFSKTNNAVNGILINGETGGTININGTGTKTLSTTTANAINLTTNTGATINFSGNNLLLTTTSGVGFNATGGGTISVTGTGNTITSTTGTALNVNATTIGGSGLTFLSISAGTAGGGPAKGISLNNTGTGGLTVTGTGTTDGTGGTIQNNATRGIELISASNVTIKNLNLTNANQTDGAIGDDFLISGYNAAIYMNTVTTAVFDNINITGTSSQGGIVGIGVSNFSLLNSFITNVGDEAHESGIEFSNLSGTCFVTNTIISFSETNSMDIVNTDVNLTLTISGSSFNDTQTQFSGGPTNSNGEGGLQFRSFSSAAGTPVSNIKIETSNFLRIRTQAIQAIAEDDSKVNIDVKTSTLDCGADIGAGIDLNANDNGQLNFNILNNVKIQSRGGAGINITSFLGGQAMGKINDNSNIVVAGNIGAGIRAVAQETSHTTIEARRNTITLDPASTTSAAIDVQARFQTARLDITLDDNTTSIGTSVLADINVVAGSSAAGESNIVCANLISNNASAPGAARALRLRVSDLSNTTRLFLQGFNTSGANTWVVNGNTPADPTEVTQSLTGTAVPPLAPAGGCAVPTNPVLARNGTTIIPIEGRNLARIKNNDIKGN